MDKIVVGDGQISNTLYCLSIEATTGNYVDLYNGVVTALCRLGVHVISNY